MRPFLVSHRNQHQYAGEFERETYEESILLAFFFHYFALFVNVVLLNVLIAIISDTYERVEEKGKVCGGGVDGVHEGKRDGMGPSGDRRG
jgi:hypothetical protein